MLPVLVTVSSSTCTWPERVLLGGLRPRGGAVIVFGLQAYNVLELPEQDIILLIVVVVVLGSVVLHGFGRPVAARAVARRRSE